MKASISFIPMKRMYLLCPIMKERRLLCESVFVQLDEWTLILKIVEREVFLMKPKAQFIYPNEENKLMFPNREKKR